MSDDPENEKMRVESTSPNPGQEQKTGEGNETPVSKLRETLVVGEENNQEQPPKKASLFKRVTGALRLNTAPKHYQTPPFVEETPSADQPAASTQPALSDNMPEADVPPASSETGETSTGENLSKSSWEGSIFDLLAQVQKGGLGHEELPETEKTASDTALADKPEVPQLPAPENQSTFALPSGKEETGGKPAPGSKTSGGMMTTSTLASRLWGLQELPTDPEELTSSHAETESGPGATTSAETQENEAKRSFLERLKGQRKEEDTESLPLDDDALFNRINRATSPLHAPPDSLTPGRVSRGNIARGKLQSDQDEGEDAGLFTFFPQDETEAPASIPGHAADGSDTVAPFFNDQPGNQPPNAHSTDNVSPFVSPEEGSIPSERLAGDHPESVENPSSISEVAGSTGGASFDIDQFLAVASPEAHSGQEEALADDEQAWPGADIENIRSIALAQSENGEKDALSNSDSSLKQAASASAKQRKGNKLIAWWTSLSTLYKIILGIAVLLNVFMAAIVIFIVSTSRPNNSGVVPVQLQPTLTPSALPHPVSVILPGGWSFALEASTLNTPLTIPGSGAWLQGSEIRRVIELPWNKQTEAVAHTFVQGDSIKLIFDDNTSLIYLFQEIRRVNATDTSVLTDVKPSLAIILSGESSTSRWVIIALPQFSQ